MFKHSIIISCLVILLGFHISVAAIMINNHGNPVSAEASLYKYIIPRTLQRETNIRDLKIVVPAEPEWEEAGLRLAAWIKTRWNITTPVSIADAGNFRTGWAGNSVLLGNLGNNAQMTPLYGLRMSYADAAYPGTGGYQLHTLIDPFGLGGNTIVIGASDIQGATAGFMRLIAILDKQSSPDIPWLLQSNLPGSTAKYFNKTADLTKARQLVSKLKPIKDDEIIAAALVEVLSQVKLYGEYYQLTGDPGLGNIYSVLLKEYTMYVNQFPKEAINQLESRRNKWMHGEKLFQQWSVLEADPMFSQLDRSQILSALYLTCEANANNEYLLGNAEKTASADHKIFPALSLSASCWYFQKYYQMPEILMWKERSDRIINEADRCF